MNSLMRQFAILSFCAFSLFAQAESTKTITFENQREEVFQLENFLKEIIYSTETVKSTCYKDVSSVENVCRMETKYRQSCTTIPAHQECGTVYDRQCRNETTYENVCRDIPGQQDCRVVVRYREECSGGDRGGRVCRTVPGSIPCRIINGENRCEKIPPHEECTDSPSTPRTCRQVPYEERECHTGPSRSECHSEPRSNQVCENVPRQKCVWIPAENVCQSVPYQEQVCANETVWRKEPYSCMKEVQVPHEKIVKTEQANVQVNFAQTTFDPKMTMLFSLSDKGVIDLKGTTNSSSKHLALLTKRITNQDNGSINSISAEYNVNFINLEDELTAETITQMSLTKNTLSFVVDGKFDQAKSTIKLNISKKDNTKFDGTANSRQFKAEFDGHQTKVTIDLEALGAPKLGGLFTKKHQVQVSLIIDYSNIGEIIGATSPKFTISKSDELKVE